MAFTQRFLPANTRIVVLAPKAKTPVWHVMKKELVIDSDDLPHAECPMTKESVNHLTKDGFQLYFPDRIIRVRLVIEDGDLDDARMAAFQPVYLSYDIPDDAMEFRKGKMRPFQNPSGLLQRYAIRVNDSDWLMDAGDVPHALIARMLDAGATPRVVRLHPEDGRKHVLEAILALQNYISDRVAGAEDSRLYADQQLAGAVEGDETTTPEEREKRYRNRIKDVTKRLDDLADDIKAVSIRFGINARVFAVGQLITTRETLATEMTKRANAYAEAAKQLAAIGTTDTTALARAMEQDQVPAGVAADALRDNGHDAAADALTNAFAGTPTVENSDVFSLDGLGTDE